MTNHLQTVVVVDDEASVRDSLKWLIESIGIPVQTFESGAAFLATCSDSRRACVVLDVRMPGMSGLEVMRRLHGRGRRTPVIFLSGHGDVSMAVRALKEGAFDFLEKPPNSQRFLDCIQSALELDALRRAKQNAEDAFFERLNTLTARELEIIGLVVAGMSNKDAGRLLGISYKTVEAHRSRLMQKMGVGCLADLVRLMTAHHAVRAECDSHPAWPPSREGLPFPAPSPLQRVR